jgi:hypothetical protein
LFREGAISGKKPVGRPRLQYLKQVARNTAADSYTAMKRMAGNNSRWKAANQSKDLRDKKTTTNITKSRKMVQYFINQLPDTLFPYFFACILFDHLFIWQQFCNTIFYTQNSKIMQTFLQHC